MQAALQAVQAVRPIAGPNTGFMAQLLAFETSEEAHRCVLRTVSPFRGIASVAPRFQPSCAMPATPLALPSLTVLAHGSQEGGAGVQHAIVRRVRPICGRAHSVRLADGAIVFAPWGSNSRAREKEQIC